MTRDDCAAAGWARATPFSGFRGGAPNFPPNCNCLRLAAWQQCDSGSGAARGGDGVQAQVCAPRSARPSSVCCAGSGGEHYRVHSFTYLFQALSSKLVDVTRLNLTSLFKHGVHFGFLQSPRPTVLHRKLSTLFFGRFQLLYACRASPHCV